MLYISEIDFDLSERYILSTIIPLVPEVLSVMTMRCLTQQEIGKWNREYGEHKGQMVLKFASPAFAQIAMNTLYNMKLGRGHLVVAPSTMAQIRDTIPGEPYPPRHGPDILDECPPEPRPFT